MAEIKPVNKLKYEEAISELEGIIQSLEDGAQSLDRATEIFARGQELLKHCAQLLETAELKIRTLSYNPSDTQGENE